MDPRDVIASIDQVERMLDRVEKVIGREYARKPLRADTSYPRRRAKPINTPIYTPVNTPSPAVASGPLTGNEMRANGYSPRPHTREDCDPGGMWATFEADFDDMVAGMR